MQPGELDLAAYLRGNVPAARPSGAPDEWVAPCPVCRGREHLYVNTAKRCGHCFRCGWSPGLVDLIARIEGRSPDEIRERLRQVVARGSLPALEQLRARVLACGARRSHASSRPPTIAFPAGYIPLAEQHAPEVERALAPFRAYLAQRRVPAGCIARHAIGCVLVGRYAGRVILPVHDEGRLVTFQARDITSRSRAKYLGPPGAPLGHVLFNLDQARSSARIVLCEGILSAICTGPDAVASFGKSLKPGQVALLAAAGRPVVVLYDGAKPATGALDALREAHRAAWQLHRAGLPVRVAHLPWGDPGDHPVEAVRQAVADAGPPTPLRTPGDWSARSRGEFR